MKKQLTPQQKRYGEYVKSKTPKSHAFRDCVRAFLVGGTICTLGQGISSAGEKLLHLSKDDASAFTAIVMVALGALLTGLGVYDRIGAFAGAGSIVPITGFANSVVAPAMEFRSEGWVFGTGAKLFTLAGPVLVFGITAAAGVGAVSWLIGLVFH